MRGLGTDHVISGPIRGLEKNCIPWRRETNKQTSGHCDSMTDPAQWGRVSEKITLEWYVVFISCKCGVSWEIEEVDPFLCIAV